MKVGYRVDDVNYLREMFTSFTDQVIMVRLTADRPGKITFNAVLTTPHQDALVDTDGECVTLSGVSSWHEGLKGKVEFQGRLATRVQGGAVSCKMAFSRWKGPMKQLYMFRLPPTSSITGYQR